MAQLISEAITPTCDPSSLAALASGEPSVPQEFIWRDTTYQLLETLSTWHTTSPCRNGSDEQYVRRHYFEIRVKTGEVMTIYFDRQPKGGKNKLRWWLYKLED